MHRNIVILILSTVCLINVGNARYHESLFSLDDLGSVEETDENNINFVQFAGNNNKYVDNGPPPHTEYAKMARYLVHRSDWTSMGTNSQEFPGFPMVNIISIADSPKQEKSTGNVYFYLTDLDFTGQDRNKDDRMTMLVSQEQDMSCTKTNTDAMEPTCARIILSGRIQVLNNKTDEYAFAYKSMLSRHPAAKKWIVTHTFYLCKLKIEKIVVLDYYGGPHYVTVDDYYNANFDWDVVDSGTIFTLFNDVQSPAYEVSQNLEPQRIYQEDDEDLDDMIEDNRVNSKRKAPQIVHIHKTIDVLRFE